MTSKMKYQLPGVDNRARETWAHVRGYEAPPEPSVVTLPDDETVVPTEPIESATLDTVVDVRVVEFAREPDRYRDCRIYKLTVAPGDVVAVSRRRERTAVQFRLDSSTATDTVYLGHDPTVGVSTGFPLRGGNTTQPTMVKTQRPLYLFNPDTVNTYDVAVIEEFITELK